MGEINNELFEKSFKKIANKKGVYSAVFRVENEDGSILWTGSTGDIEKSDKYFIASVTKFYVTAVILQLVNEGKISLEDEMIKFLPEDIVSGIHVFKGEDFSNKITIKHLISNTSGIPDYFFHKTSDNKTFADKILAGEDIALNIKDTAKYVKELTPNFKPGQNKKAAYSDTNYQLLEKIIEYVTNKSIGDVFKEYIFDKLELKNSYTYDDIEDTNPVKFYYGDKSIWVPNYMTSISGEGGIVSTAEDVMIFSKAFFAGKFFAKEKISELKQWNLILPPPSLFYYGIGLEKLFIPRIVNPFNPIGEILGFWGQTGSFAWYNPDTGLFFTGTTNQINGSGHTAAMGAIIKIIKESMK